MIFGIKRIRGDSLCSEIIAISIDFNEKFHKYESFYSCAVTKNKSNCEFRNFSNVIDRYIMSCYVISISIDIKKFVEYEKSYDDYTHSIGY